MPTLTAVAEPPRPPVTLDHLSWSGVRTFKDCPRRFSYRYIDNVPEEFESASLILGGAFHYAVEALHQARLEGDELPSTDAMLYRFQEHWDATVSAVQEVHFAKGEDEASLHGLAGRMIESYYAYFSLTNSLPDRPEVIGIEHASRFSLLSDAPPIEMRLDLLERSGDELIVTELKTSRSSWNEQKVREALPQILLYTWGLAPIMAAMEVERLTFRFVVVTKAKTPKVQVLEPTASSDDLYRVRDDVADTWRSIQSGHFPRHESWQCAQCPYRKRCQG